MRLSKQLAGCVMAAFVLASTPAPAMNYTVELGQAQLQRKVEAMFPIKHEDELYKIALDKPQVVLREGSDRIGLRLDVAGMLMQQISLNGRASMDGRLRYEPKTGEFYLDDATLAELNIEGVPPQYLGELQRVAEQAARELLNSRPIYVLGQSGESKKLMGSEIKAVSVQNGKLIIELDAF